MYHLPTSNTQGASTAENNELLEIIQSNLYGVLLHGIFKRTIYILENNKKK